MTTVITARLADVRKKDIEALSPSIIINDLDKPKRLTAISCQDLDDVKMVQDLLTSWELLFEVKEI